MELFPAIEYHVFIVNALSIENINEILLKILAIFIIFNKITFSEPNRLWLPTFTVWKVNKVQKLNWRSEILFIENRQEL